MNDAPNPADNRIDSPRIEPRLPPGQVKTEKWPVLHYGSVPTVDLATWSLQVDGRVEQPLRWTWDAFKSLPRVQVFSDIHCVTRWSRYDNLWEGVAIREVLRLAKVSIRKDLDISAVGGAFSVTLAAGRRGARPPQVESARIAFGGVAATPVRMPDAEAALCGELTPGRIESVAQLVASSISPISDVRGSAAYRRVLAANLLRRFGNEVLRG